MSHTTRVSKTVAAAALATLVAARVGTADDAGKTAARPGAEAGFGVLRMAATDKDAATLAKLLPSSLVEGWRTEAAEDGKAWRAELAARIADGTVEKVTEKGDDAVARWKAGTPPTIWALRLRFDSGAWVASSPWAYCIGGDGLAKVNGKKPAHVALKARTNRNEYGASAWSFTHATGDLGKCKNRADVWYCGAGHLHGRDAMISPLGVKDLAAPEGLQDGGDWMDQVDPKAGRVYVVDCRSENRRDFQVVLKVTSAKPSELEFDWRVVAAGKNAPASISKAQPLDSNDGSDGTDGWCLK